MKCANRGAQKSVQGDGQGNRHNYIARGAISIATCFKCMKPLIFWIMYISLVNSTLNINFQLFCCRKENKMKSTQRIKHDDKEKKGR